MYSFIHLQYQLYPGQGRGGPTAYLRNTVHEAMGWDAVYHRAQRIHTFTHSFTPKGNLA